MARDYEESPSKGEARCPGTSWDDLAAADSKPMPEFLKQNSYEYMGSQPLAAERYTGADFFRQEVEKMWPNVWQFAAREEDLPEPGDVVVYENAGRSYLVTRQADGSVRAFHNVCLHRGRKLRLESGYSKEFKCPFHGFTWNSDGSLKEIPCRWDFSHLTDEKMRCPKRASAAGVDISSCARTTPVFRSRTIWHRCRNISRAGSTRNAPP